MTVNIDTANSEEELRQILQLQKTNHASTIPESQAIRDGFVTVTHSLELLTRMNDAAPQVVAKDRGKVIGYALVMLRSFESMIPLLKPMFERLETMQYNNRRITDYSFYVMGQICVAEQYRGKGVFDSLYQKHRELYGERYELCITSVSTRNYRSMRAHERIGFEIVNTFQDPTDEWNILVWNL